MRMRRLWTIETPSGHGNGVRRRRNDEEVGRGTRCIVAVRVRERFVGHGGEGEGWGVLLTSAVNS